MRIHWRSIPRFVGTVLVAGACTDAAIPEAPLGPAGPSLDVGTGMAARGVFHRYVAIGTSVSMGWASEGVVEASQREAWPVRLAGRVNRDMSGPWVASPGCRSPFRAPLLSFVRLSGESVGIPAQDLSCAGNAPGVTLPVANTSMNAARAFDALNTTPENTPDLGNKKLYALVLPPNTTQVQVMEARNPKFVSVELGANEVLGARDGRVIPGVTVVPAQFFAPDYNAILDRVAQTVNTGAVLVGLINDAASFPAFRRGHELWLNQAEFFGAFNVAVQADCMNSTNLIVVPFRVPPAVAAGLTAKAKGQGPVPFSCTEGPSNVADYVLTPQEVGTLNAIIAGIDAHIAQQASTRGWALFRLEALFGLPKPPFSVVQLMTSGQPYGPYISLDGFHPSALGQQVLVDAAAKAINARYSMGIPTGFAALVANR